MGNTCKPMAVSFQCMTKFTTNLKKKGKKKEDFENYVVSEKKPQLEIFFSALNYKNV